MRFSFEYDQKHGNEKAQYRWDGELSGKDSDGVIGTVSWIQKKKNETKTL